MASFEDLVSDKYERGPRIRSDFLAQVVASSGGLVSVEKLRATSKNAVLELGPFSGLKIGTAYIVGVYNWGRFRP